MKNPPRKQVYLDNRVIFVDQSIDNKQKKTQQLFLMIRTVRNNLFHGGKYLPDGEIEAGRNELLVKYSIIVLLASIKLNEKTYVSYQY